jgi:hypothetical protein
LASEQQRTHVVVGPAKVTRGSSMTSRPASRINIVNTRIGAQENVDNLFLAAVGSMDERWWQRLTRQPRVDINQTTRNQRRDYA